MLDEFIKKHQRPDDKDFVEYITKQRKLAVEDVIPYNIGFYRRNPQDQKQYKISGFFDKSILFPIYDDMSHVVGFELRSIAAKNHFKFYDPKGRYFFFGMNQRALEEIFRTEEVFLTEGTFDTVTFSLWKPNVLGLMTNKISVQQMLFLRRYVKRIYLCLDADKQGLKQQKYVLEDLSKQGFHAKRFPYLTGSDKVKDANDFLKMYGRERLMREFSLRFKGV